jgi:hypothetical protein
MFKYLFIFKIYNFRIIDNTNNDKNDEYDENEDNNEINENNNKNKKYKLLNEEMMKKIKNTVDDNLKKMFNFSYENFLSKESEQESKDYVMEKERYFYDKNNSNEKF